MVMVRVTFRVRIKVRVSFRVSIRVSLGLLFVKFSYYSSFIILFCIFSFLN